MKEPEVFGNLEEKDGYNCPPKMRNIRCEDLFVRLEQSCKKEVPWNEITKFCSALTNDIFVKKIEETNQRVDDLKEVIQAEIFKTVLLT